MSLSNEGIAFKQRAFEILAHETHFYNVLDLNLSLNSVFGLFHLMMNLMTRALLVFVGVGASG